MSSVCPCRGRLRCCWSVLVTEQPDRVRRGWRRAPARSRCLGHLSVRPHPGLRGSVGERDQSGPQPSGPPVPPVETDDVWWCFSFCHFNPFLGSEGGRVSSSCQGHGHSRGWGIQAGLLCGLTPGAVSVLSVFIVRSASTGGWVMGLAPIRGCRHPPDGHGAALGGKPCSRRLQPKGLPMPDSSECRSQHLLLLSCGDGRCAPLHPETPGALVGSVHPQDKGRLYAHACMLVT